MKRRAMTLLEALVATALAALLGSVLVVALLPSFRWTARETARSHLESTAMTTIARLSGELATSSASAVSSHKSAGSDDSALLWFTPVAGVTAEATTVWDSRLVLYCWRPVEATLVREEYPPGPPLIATGSNLAFPLEVSLDEARLLTRQSNGRERRIATDVRRFQVEPGNPVRLRLRLETSYQGMTLACDASKSIFLENGNIQR